MSSLGSISVTFTANAAGFTKAIRAATQNLAAFGNAARLASSAGQPFQSTLGSMGTVASNASSNLRSLSVSTIDSTTRMNLLQAATASSQTTLASFGMGVSGATTNLGGLAAGTASAAKAQENMVQLSQKAGESTSAFTSRVDAHTQAMQKQVPAGHQLQTSYRMLGDGALQSSNRIVKANNQSIMSMINFRDFAAKIIHYLTFTIGVQMVMGVVRGIKVLITTMTDFQKEIVRTTGVAGRLGGAFEKTVDDIGAVSRELGRETIFKASEAAHAMYDLASAGFDVAGSMDTVANGVEVIGPILDYAAAQQIELADATASVSRALKMFDMDLSDSEHVVDTFTAAIANSFLTAAKLTDGLRYSGAMSHVLGIELDETVAALMSLSDAGLTGCYDEQTKVFTNEGFKYFRDLNKNEKFLSYNINTGKMEWQSAYDYIAYHYKGKMYRVKNRHTDLFVTPNHNMVVRIRGSNNFKIMQAEDVYGKDVEYTLAGTTHNKVSNFTLPSASYSDDRKRDINRKEIDGLLWTRFMAFYLAEGHYTKDVHKGNYRVVISQQENGRAYDIIKDTLDSIGYNYCYTNGQFIILSKQLHSYVKQFGRSHDKFIPDWVRKQGKDYLKEFYRVYNLCDGDNQGNIYTCSQGIINGFTEILMKIGYGVKLYKHRQAGEQHIIKDHLATCRYNQWVIFVNKKHTTPQAYIHVKGESNIEEWRHYNGQVYCVTVPNHTLVVERNGKVQISGNSQSGQRLNMIMTKLLKPTDKAKRTLAALGLTIEDISPQTHTLSQIFHTLETAGFGAGEAANFFRARTAGAAAALISHADDMERYKQTLLGAEGMTRELAERQEDTLWGSFKLLSAAVESLALDFSDLLMPILMKVTSFLKGGVIPAIKGIVDGLKYFLDIIKPIIPLIKWLGTAVLIAAGYVLLFTIYTKLATHATNMWTAALAANPITATAMAIGLIIMALIGFLDVLGLLDPIMDALSDGFKWLIDGLVSLKDSLLGNNEQFLLAKEYIEKVKEATDKYDSSLDDLIKAYDEQIDAQKEVDDLLKSEINDIDKLARAKARSAKASEEVTKKERDFYSASAKLMQGIAALSEDLDLYVETLGKLSVAQDIVIAKQEDWDEVLEDITKLQDDLTDSTHRYGIGSQEVIDIEDDLNKKYKEKIDLEAELGNLDLEREKSAKKKLDDYDKLTYAEQKYADLATSILGKEKEYKEAGLEYNKLLAKKNVLLSTRNNFERFFNERINILRDAEQKLYDIELKIYKLRHGTVDSYRDLFKALSGQGIVTNELIDTYTNMEIAEGSALKEHVEYVQTLDDLNEKNRHSVTEWTEAYIAALDEGMSKEDAKLDADRKMGISLSKISGLTTAGIKEILEYAHVRHIANDADRAYRLIAMALTNDMVDSGQAGVDLTSVYYGIIKADNDLADAEYEKALALKASDDALEGIIRTTGILYQYYKEYGNYGDDIIKTTLDMINTMGLISSVGADQESVLKRLNSFYDDNRATLEDYNQAEINAALSAIKWSEAYEQFDPKTITADDIVAELPIDDFEEFVAIALSGIGTLESEFGGLADKIEIVTDKVSFLIDKIIELIGLYIGYEPPEPPKGFFESLWTGKLDQWVKDRFGAPDVEKAIDEFNLSKDGPVLGATGIARTLGPTNAIIGEAGAEAVVPLEGANKRFGRDILEEIIPKYFPDLMGNELKMAHGGVVASSGRHISTTTTNNDTTQIDIHGDIIIQNPANADEFFDELMIKIGKQKRLRT